MCCGARSERHLVKDLCELGEKNKHTGGGDSTPSASKTLMSSAGSTTLFPGDSDLSDILPMFLTGTRVGRIGEEFEGATVDGASRVGDVTLSGNRRGSETGFVLRD